METPAEPQIVQHVAPWIAIAVSFGAAIVAVLSWRAALQSTRASIYDRRFEVYADADGFRAAWMRNGKPDLTLLPQLVSAYRRSRFLFDQAVSDHLRELWLDAVEANHCSQIISGEAEGDREAAIETKHKLLKKHAADIDRFEGVFKSSLKIKA